MEGRSLPAALQDAVMAALDEEEASSQRQPSLNAQAYRARILHGTRATLDAWQDGEVTTDEAIAELRALPERVRSAS